MISNELAKELKIAGFPQTGNGRTELYLPAARPGAVKYVTPSVYIPTLIELIEACGDHFDSLGRTIKGDSATGFHNLWYAAPKSSRYDLDWSYGETADQAVAKLYIALHAK